MAEQSKPAEKPAEPAGPAMPNTDPVEVPPDEIVDPTPMMPVTDKDSEG